jgi:hypothetical protein
LRLQDFVPNGVVFILKTTGWGLKKGAMYILRYLDIVVVSINHDAIWLNFSWKNRLQLKVNLGFILNSI